MQQSEDWWRKLGAEQAAKAHAKLAAEREKARNRARKKAEANSLLARCLTAAHRAMRKCEQCSQIAAMNCVTNQEMTPPTKPALGSALAASERADGG
jgi:hypothetical protein